MKIAPITYRGAGYGFPAEPQELRLIYANANTRKMSPAEISEQAVQVEKLLYQLKEEGYAFPGRMRDHEADAVGQSKSKLARLKVIREKLDDSWSLTESQAYALAQRPEFWQSIIKETWGHSITSLHVDPITKFRKRFENVQNLQCQHGLTICEHTVTMMEKNICSDWQAPCTGCCFDCDRLQNCKNCCPEAAGKKSVGHGHWIEHSHLEVGGECSVCGWQFQWFENAETRYCPHCGAKMDDDCPTQGNDNKTKEENRQ